MPTIVYLHGFNSVPESVKATLLAGAAERLPDAPRFHRPRLGYRPSAAMATVTTWVEGHARAADVLTFVGSSLGGFYAIWLAERYGARAVLINPAIHPDIDLAPYLGRQTNLYTGEEYELGSSDLAELEALRVDRISRPERYLLLVQAGDDVLDYRL